MVGGRQWTVCKHAARPIDSLLLSLVEAAYIAQSLQMFTARTPANIEASLGLRFYAHTCPIVLEFGHSSVLHMVHMLKRAYVLLQAHATAYALMSCYTG